MPILLAWLLAADALFSGASALEFTRQVVAFGPRPPGSAAIGKLQAFIISQLKPYGCEVTTDAFTADTPTGALPMKNIVARFRGTSGRAVAITGHYDTKLMPGIRFVGANDGGASTGLLLELARVLAKRPHQDDIFLVWFDGEEAIAEWSATDGLYGSRHLAATWARDGTLTRLKALINVDMIGDRDLGILRDSNSHPALSRLAWQAAADLGFTRHFFAGASVMEDDHMPFARRGVPVLDLIDFDYGPENSYWHTEKDTLDKLSAESFQVVGAVVLEILRRLE